jgi:hypothetical protein
MGASFEGAVLRQASRVPAAVASAIGVGSAALVAVASIESGAGEPEWVPVIGGLGICALAASIVVVLLLIRHPPLLRNAGTVSADKFGLYIDETLVAAASDLADGRMRWRRSGTPYVDFHSVRVEVDVLSDSQGDALLDAMGPAREEEGASFDVAAITPRGIALIVVAGLSGLVVSSIYWSAGWGVIAFPLLVAAGFARTRLRIGRGGLHIASLGWSRYVAIDDIVSIESKRRDLLLRTRDGRTIRLRHARSAKVALQRVLKRSKPVAGGF